MPSNPASELYNLLLHWRQTLPNQSIIQSRQMEQDSWWPMHVSAVDLLQEIRVQAQALADQGHGEIAMINSGLLDRFASAIFATDFEMNTPLPEPIRLITEEDMTALQNLGLTWPTAPAIDPNISRGLLDFAAEARKLITSDESGFEPDIEAYLLTLINGLERAVTFARRPGSHEVRQISSELVGALTALRGWDELPDSPKWRSLIKKGGTWTRLTMTNPATTAFAVGVGNAASLYLFGQPAIPPSGP